MIDTGAALGRVRENIMYKKCKGLPGGFQSKEFVAREYFESFFLLYVYNIYIIFRYVCIYSI